MIDRLFVIKRTDRIQPFKTTRTRTHMTSAIKIRASLRGVPAGSLVTLYWDEHDGWQQGRVYMKTPISGNGSGDAGPVKFVVNTTEATRGGGWLRGFSEQFVRDDDDSKVGLFAVRRGNVQPISISTLVNLRNGDTSATSYITDTSGTRVGIITYTAGDDDDDDDDYDSRDNLGLPRTSARLWEEYDLSRDKDSTQRVIQSNGYLVDIMRTVDTVRAPYRTQKADKSSRVPRWYYAAAGTMQIKEESDNDRRGAYAGIMQALTVLWYGVGADPRNKRLSDKQSQLIGVQLCTNHHAWAHYVTDKAGRGRRRGTDTWNLLRNTASPGQFGKDCDDGAIEIHATFSELCRVVGPGGMGTDIGWADHALHAFTNTYCCLMVASIIRPDGLSTPDGAAAGNTDLHNEPVHETYMSRETSDEIFSSANIPRDTAEKATRVLHMYCLFVRWDVMKKLIPRLSFEETTQQQPQLSKDECDAIIIAESTETFAGQRDMDDTVYRHHDLLSSISRDSRLKGAVRIPESHKGFVRDDFYRADITVYSEQLLEHTGIAQWDIITANADSSDKGEVGVEHHSFIQACIRAGTGSNHIDYSLKPYTISPQQRGRSMISSDTNVRYFMDSAAAAPSLPLFVTQGKRNTVTIRTIVAEFDDDAYDRVPLWCVQRESEACESLLRDMCEQGSGITACTAIKFGKLGTAFSLSIPRTRV